MPVLADTALVPGAPAGRTKVTVTIAGTTDPVYLTADPGVVIAPYSFYTDDDGEFEVTLVANDDLTPSGTAYTVTFDDAVSATIEMPSGGGPYALIDILTDTPGTLTSSALTAHIDDTAGAHAATAVSFTPTGTLAATTVQAAIVEAAAEAAAVAEPVATAHIALGPTGAHDIIVRGTAADLASANLVYPAGQWVATTDTLVVKLADGVTAYNSLPSRQPAKPDPLVAISTVAQSGISTATDITGLSIGPFTVTARPWRVMVIAGYVFGSVAGVTASVLITDLSNAMTALTSETCRGTNDTVGLPPAVEIITTPGTYSRKARLQTNTGTAGINAGIAGISATLIAEEL